MKNVVNIKELDEALKDVAESVANLTPALGKWVQTVAKKWLLTEVECFKALSVADIIKAYKQHPWMLKAYPAGTKIWEFKISDPDFRRFKEDMLVAIPYLESAAAARVNIQSIDFNAAVTEGHTMVERQKAESAGEQDADRKLLFKSGNLAWFELLTEKALRRESSYMGHCVGNERYGYFLNVQSGGLKIWSLRDRKQEPHITIEFRTATRTVQQMKGKANQAVAATYRPHLIEFLKRGIAGGHIRSFSVYDLNLNGLTPDELGCQWDENGTII